MDDICLCNVCYSGSFHVIYSVHSILVYALHIMCLIKQLIVPSLPSELSSELTLVPNCSGC